MEPPSRRQLSDDPSDLLAVYAENGQVARAMWEWRHKVITLFVISIGGVGSAFLWLADHEALDMLWVPFVFGACAVAVIALMDRTNARTLKSCYEVGQSIERTLVGDKGAIYTALCSRADDRRALTYGRLLLVVYAMTEIVMTAAAIWLAWWGRRL